MPFLRLYAQAAQEQAAGKESGPHGIDHVVRKGLDHRSKDEAMVSGWPPGRSRDRAYTLPSTIAITSASIASAFAFSASALASTSFFHASSSRPAQLMRTLR